MQIDKGIELPSSKTDILEHRLIARQMDEGDSVFFPGPGGNDNVEARRMVYALGREGYGARCRNVEGGVRVWRWKRITRELR